jgi:hypothetical protein
MNSMVVISHSYVTNYQRVDISRDRCAYDVPFGVMGQQKSQNFWVLDQASDQLSRSDGSGEPHGIPFCKACLPRHLSTQKRYSNLQVVHNA